MSVRAPLSLLTLLLTGCAPPLGAAECDELLAHYTALLVHQSRPELKAGEVEELQQRARALLAKLPDEADCSRKVSRRAYQCAMRSHDVDGVERCLVY